MQFQEQRQPNQKNSILSSRHVTAGGLGEALPPQIKVFHGFNSQQNYWLGNLNNEIRLFASQSDDTGRRCPSRKFPPDSACCLAGPVLEILPEYINNREKQNRVKYIEKLEVNMCGCYILAVYLASRGETHS